MNIGTNLHGRLRNTSLPASNALLPLYEAVSNSIHAIEDANLSPDEGRIHVEIIRGGQTRMTFTDREKRPGPEARGEITGFRVTDNGVGFNDANLQSFLTLDSEYKIERGGRGVGRLLWLKAFDRADIESVYVADNGRLKRRQFGFDARSGVSTPQTEDAVGAECQTSILLSHFAKRYREASPKTGKIIAKSLFEHCLWYFIRPAGAPQIRLSTTMKPSC